MKMRHLAAITIAVLALHGPSVSAKTQENSVSVSEAADAAISVSGPLATQLYQLVQPKFVPVFREGLGSIVTTPDFSCQHFEDAQLSTPNDSCQFYMDHGGNFSSKPSSTGGWTSVEGTVTGDPSIVHQPDGTTLETIHVSIYGEPAEHLYRWLAVAASEDVKIGQGIECAALASGTFCFFEVGADGQVNP